jgi:hypothetical protein
MDGKCGEERPQPGDGREVRLTSPDPELFRSLIQDYDRALAQQRAAEGRLIVHLRTVLRCAGHQGEYAFKDLNTSDGSFLAVRIEDRQDGQG